MVLMAAVVLPLPQGATTRLNVPRWNEDGDRTSYKKSPSFIGVFLLSLVKQRALPSLANYIITQIFCRFKFSHHQKRQVRANALSYVLLFFLILGGSVLLVDTVNLALNEFAQGLIIEFNFFFCGRIGRDGLISKRIENCLLFGEHIHNSFVNRVFTQQPIDKHIAGLLIVCVLLFVGWCLFLTRYIIHAQVSFVNAKMKFNRAIFHSVLTDDTLACII